MKIIDFALLTDGRLEVYYVNSKGFSQSFIVKYCDRLHEDLLDSIGS